MHGMLGMTMPAPAKPKAARPKPAVSHRTKSPVSTRAPIPEAAPAEPMPGMDMADPHAGHGAPVTEPVAPAGTALMPGNAAPPPVPTDHYADRRYPGGAMAASRARMMRENGGQTFHQILFNLAELQIRDGRDGYRWDGEGWVGGDIDRAVVRTEGSGDIRGGIEAAEVQALYSHAIGPYFDLQGGVRQDFAAGPARARTYATIGVEGLAPYMFDVEAAAFVSTRGEVLARIEAWYDQRLTQRLALQPRVELNLAAQDVAATRTGAGLSDAELGLRLRYELAREFAPYVGVSYEAKAGRTADFARVDGRGVSSTSLVGGIRFWF